jgi:hypothetical protein
MFKVINPTQAYNLMIDETNYNYPHPVMNFCVHIQDIGLNTVTIETELFPKAALCAYTRYNMGLFLDESDQQWFTPQRGGPQGDYRLSANRIDKVIEALRTRLCSKRAVMTIPYNNQFQDSINEWEDSEFKCLRELYFSIDENNKLNCTGVMRSQAVSIFPKNIHYISNVIHKVAQELGVKVGSYVHFCHFLVKDRE